MLTNIANIINNRIGQDKQLHFFWMAALSAIMTNIGMLTNLEPWIYRVITLIVCSFLIIMKEKEDGNKNSRSEHINDMIAGYLGVALGMMLKGGL